MKARNITLMKTLLKILQIFLMTMGVIFLILIGVAAYVIIADPFGIRDLMKPADVTIEAEGAGETEGAEGAGVVDKNPLLTPQQEAFAESIGIDPATLPTEVTPEMESCLIEAVGEERAAEIQAGATPTPFEIFKAKGCL
jgi:hypothetical protein